MLNKKYYSCYRSFWLISEACFPKNVQYSIFLGEINYNNIFRGGGDNSIITFFSVLILVKSKLKKNIEFRSHASSLFKRSLCCLIRICGQSSFFSLNNGSLIPCILNVKNMSSCWFLLHAEIYINNFNWHYECKIKDERGTQYTKRSKGCVEQLYYLYYIIPMLNKQTKNIHES